MTKIVDLYFKDFNFNDFTFYFSFFICTFDRSRKIGFTTAVWPLIILGKNRRHVHFPNRYPQIKFLFSGWPLSKIWTKPLTGSSIHDPILDC